MSKPERGLGFGTGVLTEFYFRCINFEMSIRYQIGTLLVSS